MLLTIRQVLPIDEDRTYTHNIEPNLPAPIKPTWIGLPAASRSASFVERLVMISDLILDATLETRNVQEEQN